MPTAIIFTNSVAILQVIVADGVALQKASLQVSATVVLLLEAFSQLRAVGLITGRSAWLSRLQCLEE